MSEGVSRDEIRALEDSFNARLEKTHQIALEAKMNGLTHEQICTIRYGNINANLALINSRAWTMLLSSMGGLVVAVCSLAVMVFARP